MKKIIVSFIVLLLVASFAWASEKEIAAQQAAGLNGMRDVFKSVPNLDECVKPGPVKIYKTEYQGATFYKASSSSSIFTLLESAQFIAAQADDDSAYFYRLCQRRIKDNQIAELKREAKEDADKNSHWIEVK